MVADVDLKELMTAVKERLTTKTEARTAYTYWRALLQFDFKEKPTLAVLIARTGEWKRAGLSNGTIAHRYCAVKWVLKNFPREFDPIDVQEMLTFMEGVTPDVREMDFATLEEAETVIRKAPPREALAIGMAYYGGLRLGEIAQSKVTDWTVDKTTGRLSLLIPSPPKARTKTGRERRIPVMPQLEELFETYVKGDRRRRLETTGLETDVLLLPNQGQKATGLSRRALYEAIVTVCKQCGYGHLHPHAFRHGLATILATKTNDIKLIKEVLGHRNVQSTLRYIHKAQAEIADSMASVFK